MNAKQVRNVIQDALLNMQVPGGRVEVVPIGNAVHLFVDDDEFEVVIRTLPPRGSQQPELKLDW